MRAVTPSVRMPEPAAETTVFLSTVADKAPCCKTRDRHPSGGCVALGRPLASVVHVANSGPGPGHRGDAMTAAARSPFRPRICVWELTLRCNLRCRHCGSSAGAARDRELTTDQCLSLVDDLADLGCEVITLSGGEPTLRDDWETIAAAAAGRDVLVNMVTNGVRLDDALADRIAGSALCNVAVSVDGPAAVHEYVRGPGTFAPVVRAIERLVARDVSTAVMFTVGRHNLHHMEETRELAASLGASMFRVQLAKPMGNLAPEDDDLVLRPRDMLTLLPLIAGMRAAGGIQVKVGDSVTIIDSRPERPNSLESLAAIAGTIPYELACLLGNRIRRVPTGRGREIVEAPLVTTLRPPGELLQDAAVSRRTRLRVSRSSRTRPTAEAEGTTD